MKMAVFWNVAHVVWEILTNVSEELTASIIRVMSLLMMEAVSSSETSVNIYQTTQCNISEDSHLHTRRCENLKSHLHICTFQLDVSGITKFVINRNMTRLMEKIVDCM
jgi:hypothetical protein